MLAKRSNLKILKFVPPRCGTQGPLCEVAPRESAGPLPSTLRSPRLGLCQDTRIGLHYTPRHIHCVATNTSQLVPADLGVRALARTSDQPGYYRTVHTHLWIHCMIKITSGITSDQNSVISGITSGNHIRAESSHIRGGALPVGAYAHAPAVN